jgi:hypothetical protein
MLLFVGLVVLGNYLTQWFIEQLNIGVKPSNEATVHRIILVSMLTYAILMSIPFVPGAEIGVAALMILGPDIALFVYLATLAALSLSFFVGRFIPEKILISFLKDLHLHRASQLLSDFEGLDSKQRLNLMVSRSPKRFLPFLLKYRYLALMLAINMPGNIVIGGGGGIALMAGLSRLFTPPMYLLAVAIAVSPIPVVMMIYGNIFS